MAELWSSFREISDFARNRAAALDIVVVVRRVSGGWELPYYQSAWNGVIPSRLEDEAARDREEYEEWAAMPSAEDEDHGDGSSGASSNCGETMMEGYALFNRN